MSRAAYMREYRAKRKAKIPELTGDAEKDLVAMINEGMRVERDVIAAESHIRFLEGEVVRLKRELAARPLPSVTIGGPRPDSFREYRPVPKVRSK